MTTVDTPIPPVVPYGPPNEENVIYEGPLHIGQVTGNGQARLVWRPQPRLTLEVEPADPLAALDPEILGKNDFELIDVGANGTCLVTSANPLSGITHVIRVGEQSKVRRVRFGVANFRNLLLPDSLSEKTECGRRMWRGRVSFSGQGWKVVLDARPDLSDIAKQLKQEGGFAVTHTGVLERSDGRVFTSEEADDTLWAIAVVLSFCRGAWTAIPIARGETEDGAAVWERWADQQCDSWYKPLSWLDQPYGVAVADVGSAFLELWGDPFWHEVLRVAVIHYLEANRSGGGRAPFVESRIVQAQAGLELLANVLIDEGRGPASATAMPGGGGPAAGRIRGLLAAADIPADIDLSLSSLVSFKNAVNGGPDLDGPWAVAKVRNRIVHPKRSPDQNGLLAYVLDGDITRDAWKLSLWYLELLLLWILGYEGGYGSRLVDGRWEGDTQPVPWA